MRLEHYPPEKLKKEILEIVRRRLDFSDCRVFFFGSRVTGGGSDRSDIDVGIESRKPIPFDVISDIQEEIDALSTLYKIEVVDFNRVPAKFREVAEKSREFISFSP